MDRIDMEHPVSTPEPVGLAVLASAVAVSAIGLTLAGVSYLQAFLAVAQGGSVAASAPGSVLVMEAVSMASPGLTVGAAIALPGMACVAAVLVARERHRWD